MTRLRGIDEQPDDIHHHEGRERLNPVSPPGSIVYDGATDVTSWVKASVTGVAGAIRFQQALRHSPTTPRHDHRHAAYFAAHGSGHYTSWPIIQATPNYTCSASSAVTFTINPARRLRSRSPPADEHRLRRPLDVTNWVKATSGTTANRLDRQDHVHLLRRQRGHRHAAEFPARSCGNIHGRGQVRRRCKLPGCQRATR